ncbi:hypothetical protein C2831_03830 [Pasteurella multocida]|uniref:Uncharacterized protein n=1 Tax=Pasteurella multocida TaxID=747 RepID=A0A849CK29_PASMD|nr:hypothetical protein DID83_05760 [Pasteurella multocida]EGP05844.1 hypothetical protein GEW_05468 [Pasteurella multocida subsp. gallicida str. Anand1_poultry]OBP40187.1 hypothetical protein A0R72_03335 [Pasteurella multocida subsp. multocida]MDH3003221.1 hypothetical protein [Pasteurella multocida]NNH93989.1 hypothetical protein [Pasteurella multocida]
MQIKTVVFVILITKYPTGMNFYWLFKITYFIMQKNQNSMLKKKLMAIFQNGVGDRGILDFTVILHTKRGNTLCV